MAKGLSENTDFIIMGATHNSRTLPSNNYLFAMFTWGSCVRITKTKKKENTLFGPNEALN